MFYPDWLFYSRKKNTQTYTDENTSNFDVDAYLQGRLDFWRIDDITEKKLPKKILLCDWTYEVWTSQKRVTTELLFQTMKNDEAHPFEFFIWTNDGACPLELKDFDYIRKIPFATPAYMRLKISEAFSVSADELLLLGYLELKKLIEKEDKNQIDLYDFMGMDIPPDQIVQQLKASETKPDGVLDSYKETDDNDVFNKIKEEWEKGSGFPLLKQIRHLDMKSSNHDKFAKLFEEEKIDRLKTLCLHDCGTQWRILSGSSVFSGITRLKLRGSVSLFLFELIESMGCLEELDLSFNMNLCFVKEKNSSALNTLSKIIILKLSVASFPSSMLMFFLNTCLGLRVLDLFFCKNLNLSESEIKQLKGYALSKITHLNVSRSDISTTMLVAFLNRSLNLRVLNLSSCGNLSFSESEIEKLNSDALSKITHLNVSRSDISTTMLVAFLNRSLDLRVLNLSSCGNLSFSESEIEKLNPDALSKITHLNVSGSDISLAMLTALLKRTLHLRELNLSCFKNEINGLSDDAFSKITHLDLSGINISSARLITFLNRSLNLRVLNLSSCGNLSLSENEINQLNKDALLQMTKLNLLGTNISPFAVSVLLDRMTSLKRFNILMSQVDAKKIDNTHSRYQCLEICSPGDGYLSFEHVPSFYDIRKNTTVLTNADTSQTDNTLTFNRYFTPPAERPDPSPAEYRLSAYDMLTLQSESKHFFLLRNETSGKQDGVSPTSVSSLAELTNIQNKKDKIRYKGWTKLNGTQWISLPSLSPNETLTHFYSQEGKNIEIAYNQTNNFYFARLKQERAQSCYLYYLVAVPPRPTLSSDLVCFVEQYKDFEIGTLNHTPTSGEDALKILKKEKKGSCRHRAIVCLADSKKQNIDCRVIMNDVHAFVEIKENNQWIACDLGGYPAALEEKPLPSDLETLSASSQAIEIEPEPTPTFTLDAALSTSKILLEMPDEKIPATLLAIQRRCLKEHFPFYAVLSRRDMGGGPLADFLAQAKTAARALLVINWNAFTPHEIAAYNHVMDEPSTLQGENLPENVFVIGLSDPTHPNAYRGLDFLTRCRTQGILSPEENIPTFSEPPEGNAEIVIDFIMGGDYWAPFLLGQDQPQNGGLVFQPGALQKALATGKTIELRNAPWEKPDFQLFWQSLQERREVVLPTQDPLVKRQLTVKASFVRSNGIKWEALNAFKTERTGTPPADARLLNSSFLSQYERIYVLKDEQLVWQPGYLTQAKSEGKTSLNVCLTRPLTERQWAHLLLLAKQAGITLNIYDTPIARFEMSLPPEHDWVLDISECTAGQLLTRYVRQPGNHFQFKEEKGALLKALEKGKNVVLTGTFSDTLMDHLIPILDKFPQQLTLLTKASPPVPPQPISYLPEARLAVFLRRLSESPFLFLVGPTGAGKSTFIQKVIGQQPDVMLYQGEKEITNWANNNDITDDRKIILFIDEANMRGKDYTDFNGLFDTPPSLLIDNKRIFLTEKHKVVFAGNDVKDGGERELCQLFQDHPDAQFDFHPLSLNEIKKSLEKISPEHVPLFLACYDQIKATPRTLEMMGLWSKAYKHDKNEALKAAYYLGKQRALNQSDFDSWFREKYSFQPSNIPEKLNTFYLLSSRQPAFEILRAFLAIEPQEGVQGLRGMMLEGPASTGKSTFVREVLTHFGKEFIEIPVSCSFSEKEALLLKAFHDGKIVIIDELNTMPLSEALLNTLLSGVDEDGKPPAQKGFKLIVTQNGTEYPGRQPIPAPLAQRFIKIDFPDYSKKECEILAEKLNCSQEETKQLIQGCSSLRQIKEKSLIFSNMQFAGRKPPFVVAATAVNKETATKIRKLR